MNSKKRILFIMTVVLVILFIINPRTLAYFESKFGNPDQQLTLLKELELPHSSQIKYARLGQQLIQYWDGILYSYDMEGNQNWSVSLGASNPEMITSHNEVILVDSSKKEIIKVNNQGQLIYSILANESIADIKLCNEGYVLVYYTPQGGPLRSFEIFDSKGNRYGEITVSEGEVINSTISGKEKKVLIYTTQVAKGNIEGSLMEFDLKGNLLAIESMGPGIPLNVNFDDNGNRKIVYTDRVMYGGKDEVKWTLDEEGLQSIAEEGKLMVLYFKKAGGIGFFKKSEDKLRIYDFQGDLMGETVLEDQMKGLDLLEGEIVSYSDRSIYLFNDRAELKMNFKYNGDIEQVFMLPQGNMAVITKEKLAFYKIQ
ncbi:DUF5711 family protein [Alkaliphilus crotonatoxidans]